MIKKEEKPKETIVEPIFEEILPGVMAAPPELVEAFAPELAPEVALPAERVVVPLAPARPHYYGLRGEMFSTPCTARSLFIYLFRFTFECGVSVGVKLRVPGTVWEVCEDAEYDVTVSNYTGFDLRDIRLSLSKSADEGKASILPPGSSIVLGDIDYAHSGTGTFKLHGDEAGEITLKIRVCGYIGPWRSRVCKPRYERTYQIY